MNSSVIVLHVVFIQDRILLSPLPQHLLTSRQHSRTRRVSLRAEAALRGQEGAAPRKAQGRGGSPREEGEAHEEGDGRQAEEEEEEAKGSSCVRDAAAGTP